MGLTGIETSVPMFLEAAYHQRGMSLTRIAEMTATAPAKTLGLYSKKGAIGIGFDADIVLYDMDKPWMVEGAKFRGYATWSAFEGMTCRPRVVQTIVRGNIVYNARSNTGPIPGYGQFLRRQPQSDSLEERAFTHV